MAVLCSNDAKSCYDQIMLLIAALAMCWLGGQDNWLKSMVNTLVEMMHHIRTAYGDSNQGKNHKDWVNPITGIGQGNGQIWAAVSMFLFNIMREGGMFASIVSAISHQKLNISRFAFVNNTDLIVTQPQGNMDNIQTKIQKSMTNWEGLLKALGIRVCNYVSLTLTL